MILVDTSVWVEFFRAGSGKLAALLLDDQVLCHPWVVGELACGSLKNRGEILTLLLALPQSESAEDGEVLEFIERHRLYGRGLGWVDVHLLFSAVLSRAALWTRDRRLTVAAASLGVAA